jgi:hypothetical protein
MGEGQQRRNETVLGRIRYGAYRKVPSRDKGDKD